MENISWEAITQATYITFTSNLKSSLSAWCFCHSNRNLFSLNKFHWNPCFPICWTTSSSHGSYFYLVQHAVFITRTTIVLCLPMTLYCLWTSFHHTMWSYCLVNPDFGNLFSTLNTDQSILWCCQQHKNPCLWCLIQLPPDKLSVPWYSPLAIP